MRITSKVIKRGGRGRAVSFPFLRKFLTERLNFRCWYQYPSCLFYLFLLRPIIKHTNCLTFKSRTRYQQISLALLWHHFYMRIEPTTFRSWAELTPNFLWILNIIINSYSNFWNQSELPRVIGTQLTKWELMSGPSLHVQTPTAQPLPPTVGHSRRSIKSWNANFFDIFGMVWLKPTKSENNIHLDYHQEL